MNQWKIGDVKITRLVEIETAQKGTWLIPNASLENVKKEADWLFPTFADETGRLRRSWKDGRASAPGVLEDHADLAEGLLALYQATFDERWFLLARRLADTILGHFADPEGAFFDTADDHEALVARPKDLQDNALPSGPAMATTVLLRVAALTGAGDDISEIALDSSADEALPALIDELRRAAPALDVQSWETLAPLVYAVSTFFGDFVVMWLGMMIPLIAVGIVNTQLTAVFERRHEFGPLQALGILPPPGVRGGGPGFGLFFSIGAVCGVAAGLGVEA